MDENGRCPYCKNGWIWIDGKNEKIPVTCSFCYGTGKKPCPTCLGMGLFMESTIGGSYVVRKCSCQKSRDGE